MHKPQAGPLHCISGTPIAMLSAQLSADSFPVLPNVLFDRREELFANLLLHPKVVGDMWMLWCSGPDSLLLSVDLEPLSSMVLKRWWLGLWVPGRCHQGGEHLIYLWERSDFQKRSVYGAKYEVGVLVYSMSSLLVNTSNCFPSAVRKLSRTLEKKTPGMLVVKLASSHILLEWEKAFENCLDGKVLLLPVAEATVLHWESLVLAGIHEYIHQPASCPWCRWLMACRRGLLQEHPGITGLCLLSQGV